MCVLFVFCICTCLCVIYYSYSFLRLSDVSMGQNWGNDEPTTLISIGTKPSALEGLRILTPTLHSMSIYTHKPLSSAPKKSANDDLLLLVGSRTTRSCPRTDPKCSHHPKQTMYHVSIFFFHLCAPANMLASACIELTLGVGTPGCQSNCMLIGYILAILVAQPSSFGSQILFWASFRKQSSWKWCSGCEWWDLKEMGI